MIGMGGSYSAAFSHYLIGHICSENPRAVPIRVTYFCNSGMTSNLVATSLDGLRDLRKAG